MAKRNRSNDEIRNLMDSLKKQIGDLESEHSELQGKLKLMKEQLRKEHNCKTIKQAEGVYEEMKLELEDLKSQRNVLIDQIKEDYDLN